MTARSWFAAGARALLDARKAGTVPDGPVVVACREGSFPGAAAVLFVKPDMPADRLDWRMLVNLETWLWADETMPLPRLMGIARQIAMVRPKRLVLRFDRPCRWEWSDVDRIRLEEIDTHDVDVGSGYHTPAIEDVPASHFFVWFPIDATGSPIGLSLKMALAKQYGEYEVL